MWPHVCIELENVTWRFWYVRRRMDWCILRPYICLRETKFKSLQCKIINRIIDCNKMLFDVKIKTPPYVHTVIKQMTYIGHFFFVCKNVYAFWKGICTWWNTLDYDIVDVPTFPNVKTVIFGSQCITETVAVLNFRMFHIKYYIYRQRLFQDNVFYLHEIQIAILAKLEIKKKNLSKRK